MKRQKLQAVHSKIICMVLAMAVMAVSGGFGYEAKAISKSAGKQLTIAVSTDVGADKLDAASYNGMIQAYTMVYDSLVEYGNKGKIIPSLAQSWNISKDGKVYTLHLRKGVKFSDGTPFNAAAVKFSFDRWYKDPANSSISAAKEMSKIEAVDPYTIKMTFNKAYYPFLTELTYPRPVRIISPSAVTPKGDIKGKFVKPVGTGPWVVSSYKKDQQTVFVRNPYYWGVKPKISTLVLKVIPDAQTRFYSLQSGEVDLAGGQMGKLSSDNLSSIRSNKNLKTYSVPGTSSYFLVLNYDNSSLKNVNVRKALNYAVDRGSIVKNIMSGLGDKANGLFPETVPYVTKSNNKWYAYDVTKAKKALKDAGYSDTNGDGIVEKGGKALEFNLVLQNSEFPEWKTICEYVQAQCSAVGIKINLQLLDSNAYYDTLWKNRKYDIIIYRTYSDSWNPHGFLTSLFHSSGNTKAVAWSDKALENTIDKALVTMNEKDRQKQYDSIFNQIYQNAMAVPLYYPSDLFVMSSKVKGFKAGADSYAPIDWSSIDISK